jgi:hypothetical protein
VGCVATRTLEETTVLLLARPATARERRAQRGLALAGGLTTTCARGRDRCRRSRRARRAPPSARPRG